MRAKTCTPLLPGLPHKRLKVAKKELDSENESALLGWGVLSLASSQQAI